MHETACAAIARLWAVLPSKRSHVPERTATHSDIYTNLNNAVQYHAKKNLRQTEQVVLPRNRFHPKQGCPKSGPRAKKPCNPKEKETTGPPRRNCAEVQTTTNRLNSHSARSKKGQKRAQTSCIDQGPANKPPQQLGRGQRPKGAEPNRDPTVISAAADTRGTGKVKHASYPCKLYRGRGRGGGRALRAPA